MLRRREVLNDIVIRHTDQPTPQVAEETARDCFLTPDEA
jgi:ATP-dependent protease ClpP protease subunit